MSGSLEELRTDVVLTASSVELEKHTLNTVLAAIREEWKRAGVGRPHRVQYTRGEQLLIERFTPRALEPGGLAGMVTPYQAIRTMSDLEILPEREAALTTLCLASELLHRKGTPTRIIVCKAREELDRWIGQELDVGRVFNVRVLEDPELPSAARCFVCGSATGDMLLDVETSIAISREAT